MTKSNFTLSYANKNHSFKLIFDILKPNTNQYFKSNSSKSNFFNLFFLKVILPKVKPNIALVGEENDDMKYNRRNMK